MNLKKKTSRKKYALVVKKSRTGKGLFAGEDIPKGVRIIEYIGTPVSPESVKRRSGKYLFWTSDTEMIDGNIKENIARFINHACKPNCEANGPDGKVFIESRRRIKAGEELTYDYGDEYVAEHFKKSGCRCATCAPAHTI